MTERRAEDASRDVIQWLKCEYLKERVGDQMMARVTAVTQFGMFAELEDIYIDGLIHITTLPKDYYEYDPMALSLVGQDTKRAFNLGDQLCVKIVRVSLEERKIDLILAETAEERDSKPHKRRLKKGKGFRKKPGKSGPKGRKRLSKKRK